MEAKLLIFTFNLSYFTNVASPWVYTAIPLSERLLWTSCSTENIPSLQISHVVHLLGELDKLLSDVGPLNGWTLYQMEEPIQIESKIHAKVIIMKA